VIKVVVQLTITAWLALGAAVAWQSGSAGLRVAGIR
jgi:hypothetical protein